MPLMDIVIFGLVVNFLLFIVFTIFMTILMTINVNDDPKQIIEFQKLERAIANHKDELRLASPDEKYKDFIIFMMPFSGILKYSYLIYIISKAGGMYNYVKNETERLRGKRHERKIR